MDKSGIKLTPALRRMLEFIASGEEHGRMIVQIVATGGALGVAAGCPAERRLRRILLCT
jgi:hypothetical protein